VIWSLLFFAAAFAAGLYLAADLEHIVKAPMTDVWANPTMIYTDVSDALSVQFSLAGLFALLASSPFWLWQLWKYVAPALRKDEKKIAAPLAVISPVLFLAGAAFAYFVLLPIMFEFFIDIGSANVAMMPNMKGYLSFSVGILKAFGFAFQFPLVLVLLNRAGVVSKGQILSAGRYLIIGIFVIAAVLTPPDVISQVALAAPLILLFGLSFLFMV
jgi:sec-independent protein translocase protein TatC